jgi:molybdopterin synthase catalytic subunit
MRSTCWPVDARTDVAGTPYGDDVEVSTDQEPAAGARDWIAVGDGELPTARAVAWATIPGCGAVVSFHGTVRDHSPGREGVHALEYELHPDGTVPRLHEVAAAARRRWPMIGRLAILHRSGVLAVGDAAVVVVVSTPHRAEAFDAAEFCIDTLKRTVPIWKHERWAGGSAWSECTHELEDVGP